MTKVQDVIAYDCYVGRSGTALLMIPLHD